MESHLTAKFRALFQQLPQEVRRDAKKSYLLWKRDPFHSSLHFKRISEKKNVWSVRASLGWRALGVREEPDVIVWVWVGPHADYDEAIKPKNVKKMQSPSLLIIIACHLLTYKDPLPSHLNSYASEEHRRSNHGRDYIGKCRSENLCASARWRFSKSAEC